MTYISKRKPTDNTFDDDVTASQVIFYQDYFD